MTDNTTFDEQFYPWHYINSSMRDIDFRRYVLRTAWKQRPKASRELQDFAVERLLQHLNVRGFRNGSRRILKLAYSTVSESLNQQFSQSEDVADAVIALWADAEADIVDATRHLISQHDPSLPSEWHWQQAIKGFRDDELINQFREILDNQLADEDEFTRWKYALALFWLSGGIDTAIDEINTEDSGTRLDVQADTLSADGEGSRAIADTSDLNLSIIYDELNQHLDNLNTAWEQIQPYADTLPPLFDDRATDALQHRTTALLQHLEDYRAIEQDVSELVTHSVLFLGDELKQRPDLDVTLDYSGQGDVSVPDRAHDILNVVQEIATYDAKLNQLLSECETILSEIRLLVSQMDGTARSIPVDTDDLDDITQCQEASTRRNELRKTLTDIEKQYERHQSDRLMRIAQLQEQLEAMGVESVPADMDDSVLSDSVLRQKTLGELQQIIERLQTHHGQAVQMQKQAKLAAKIDNLSVETTLDVQESLETLAASEYHIETLLLLLSCMSDNHSRLLTLSREVVDSLLYSLQEMSSTTGSFVLFHRLSPLLLQQWQSDDTLAQIKIQLMIIGAACLSPRLPEIVIWQFPHTQWALEDTPVWQHLWEYLLQNNNLPAFVRDEDIEQAIQDARSAAREALKKENERYVRLGSINSRRHAKMLATGLLPQLETQLQTISQQYAIYRKIPANEIAWRWPQVQSALLDELNKLQDDRLQERYEAAIADANIRDNNPFLQEKAQGFFMRCARTVREYGQVVLETGNYIAENTAQISLQMLRDEMRTWPDEIETLAKQVLQYMDVLENGDERPFAEAHTLIREGHQMVVDALLDDAGIISRLPRLVSHVVNDNDAFASWREPLIQDVTDPIAFDEIASHLLQHHAPDQVLLLSDVPLEQQKNAQEIQSRLKNQVNTLEKQIIQMGGDTSPNVEPWLATGRYGCAITELEEEATQLEIAQKEAARREKEQRIALLKDANSLDIQLLEADNIPVDIKTLLSEGIAIAQKSARQSRLFDEMQAFLQDVQYRLDYDSWNINDIKVNVDRLRQADREMTVPVSTDLTIEKTLDYLNREELAQLGFSENQLTLSSRETRAHVIEHWLALREMSHFKTDNMTQQERQTIYDLYRYFAKLCSMQKVRTVNDRHLRGEDITPYAFYELTYPKTHALNQQAVFVTLPGEKPGSSAREAFEELISGKEWVNLYFVIVFIPGCTPRLRKALESQYNKKGLIIIDEAALNQIVTAETFGSKPIGKLRALMLNSLRLEYIDIFTVNQSVNAKLSIFVGRDYVVEQVTSSADNYALYGGRRIGKTSVIYAIEERLKRRNVRVVTFDFQGREDCSNSHIAWLLANRLHITSPVHSIEALRNEIGELLENDNSLSLVFLFDEIDSYINDNPDRHLLIEMLRSLSEQYGERLRVIVAGFMNLYDCMKGRGPYTSTSDPWLRMFNQRLLGNLTAESAEGIVREGFIEILGWEFEHRSIPQEVVKRTGGHPAFVQKFCEKVQDRVARRGDTLIRLSDLDVVFDDADPENSFIAYVRKTLELNLDPIAHYVIVWLAKDSEFVHSFRFEQLKQYADLLSIPSDILKRSVEHLLATSVITERQNQLYEFTVPDYPSILRRLGDTNHLDSLEDDVKAYINEWETGV